MQKQPGRRTRQSLRSSLCTSPSCTPSCPLGGNIEKLYCNLHVFAHVTLNNLFCGSFELFPRVSNVLIHACHLVRQQVILNSIESEKYLMIQGSPLFVNSSVPPPSLVRPLIHLTCLKAQLTLIFWEPSN